MKNKFVFILSFLLIALAACEDDIKSYEEQLEIDVDKIEKYLSENDLTAESTESGLHYIIEVEGTGAQPTINSKVNVTYTGKFLNGEVFDSGTLEYELILFIAGWQEGIPLMHSGGKAKLFIPSGLGYGTSARSSIPANSVLIFDIELHGFTN